MIGANIKVNLLFQFFLLSVAPSSKAIMKYYVHWGYTNNIESKSKANLFKKSVLHQHAK
jgi:hypothetical protein